MGGFNILNFLWFYVLREIWLEAWFTRYGLRVLMARSDDLERNDPPRLQCSDINLVLGISKGRV
jgi:hypothetical protein